VLLEHARIRELVAARYLTETRHPEADLYLYNYTPRTQYAHYWTPETCACRGLILDSKGQVVARPFPKFFELEENDTLPEDEPFEVYEKLDGSLVILYFHAGCPALATRSSFTSRQARSATALLHELYAEAIPRLDGRLTYLFEFIHPDNRIVVDYGERRELVLLAAIETASGNELPPPAIGFPTVRRIEGIRSLTELRALEDDRAEGYVIRFASGKRVKVKFAAYRRIHRKLTRTSALTLWDRLRTGQSFDDLLADTPPRFRAWVAQTAEQLLDRYRAIETRARKEFRVFAERRVTAEYFRGCAEPTVLFAMLDGKDYTEEIWRRVRPTGAQPFLNEAG